jgi:hypothetical protein
MASNVYMQPKAKFTIGGIFVLGSIFLSIALMVLVINIYRETFIPTTDTIIIWSVFGILGLPLYLICIPRNERKDRRYLFISPFVLFCWGAIGYYCFMAYNFHVTNKINVGQKLSILRTGHLGQSRGGCLIPYVEVNFEGLDKTLVFPCGIPIEKYNMVTVVLNKGHLGYYVIIDKKLSNERK